MTLVIDSRRAHPKHEMAARGGEMTSYCNGFTYSGYCLRCLCALRSCAGTPSPTVSVPDCWRVTSVAESCDTTCGADPCDEAWVLFSGLFLQGLLVHSFIIPAGLTGFSLPHARQPRSKENPVAPRVSMHPPSAHRWEGRPRGAAASPASRTPKKAGRGLVRGVQIRPSRRSDRGRLHGPGRLGRRVVDGRSRRGRVGGRRRGQRRRGRGRLRARRARGRLLSLIHI